MSDRIGPPPVVDASGALTPGGDKLLHELFALGFRVRRYGDQAALDDETGQGRVPPIELIFAFAEKQTEYSALLRVHGAPN